jgi:hypothetical protein
VLVGDPKTRALGRDASQIRRPLLPVALPEAVFGNRIARVHGEQPGEAHVEGLLGTRQQVGLRLVEALLYLRKRRLGAGVQFDQDVVGPTRPCPQRTDSHPVARHPFSVRLP